MAKALVSCPVTASTELIEFVDTPIGVLIHGCSRFRPSTAVTCGRTCANSRRCDLAKSNAEFDTEDEDDADTSVDIELSLLCERR